MGEIDVASALYTEAEVNRQLPRTLMGGTKTMRAARTEYLPQWADEEEKSYNNRLARTFLFNGFKRAIFSHVGQIFDRPVIVTEGSKRLIEDWVPNITNEGRSLTAFLRDVSETALAEGCSFIQVEYPRAPGGTTLADDRKLDLRPYLIEVEPKDLIFWNWQVQFGKPVLTEVRIKERYFDDSAGKLLDQIRVLTPGVWSVFRMNKEGTWFEHESGSTEPIKRVPIVPIYTGKRSGVLVADPPLDDLANLNHEHWMSSSDQRHILHVARVPLLFASGWGESVKKITVGPNRLIKSDVAGATLEYVEHTGAAISAGRDDLKDIEGRMEKLALEMLMTDRSGDITATERAIEKAENESALQSVATHIQDATAEALGIMEEWAGVGPGDDVVADVNREFEIKISDNSELTDLRELRMGGDLTRDSLWAEYKRRGVLRDDFDADDEAAALELEGPAGGDAGGE